MNNLLKAIFSKSTYLSLMNNHKIRFSPCKDFWCVAFRQTDKELKREIDVRELSTELLQRQLINVNYHLYLTAEQKMRIKKIINKELSKRLFSWV